MAGEGSTVADAVRDLIAPVVDTTDVELIDVEWVGQTLRVTIDQAGGVTAESLAMVNRLVSPLLDQHDPVPGRYTLEVSSPGIERPLRLIEHFRRAVGEHVIVKLTPGLEPRRIRGVLAEVDGSELMIEAVEVDGVDLVEMKVQSVQLDDVNKARTVFDWGPEPNTGNRAKPNRSKNAKSKNAKSKPSKSKNVKSKPGNKKAPSTTTQVRTGVADE